MYVCIDAYVYTRIHIYINIAIDQCLPSTGMEASVFSWRLFAGELSGLSASFFFLIFFLLSGSVCLSLAVSVCRAPAVIAASTRVRSSETLPDVDSKKLHAGKKIDTRCRCLSVRHLSTRTYASSAYRLLRCPQVHRKQKKRNRERRRLLLQRLGKDTLQEHHRPAPYLSVCLSLSLCLSIHPHPSICHWTEERFCSKQGRRSFFLSFFLRCFPHSQWGVCRCGQEVSCLGPSSCPSARTRLSTFFGTRLRRRSCTYRGAEWERKGDVFRHEKKVGTSFPHV